MSVRAIAKFGLKCNRQIWIKMTNAAHITTCIEQTTTGAREASNAPFDSCKGEYTRYLWTGFKMHAVYLCILYLFLLITEMRMI